MKGLLGRPKENISNRNGCQEQDDLQPLRIFHLESVEIGLVESKLLQSLKQSNSNIWLAALCARVGNC